MIRPSLLASAACAALAFKVPATAADPHRCAEAAREQAGKLLAFHFGAPPGPGQLIEIDKYVRELPPQQNPAKSQQLLDALEVWGYIYKGQYRMRFIFAPIPNQCVLVGQEILEYAAF
jgi:hypothetical protein